MEFQLLNGFYIKYRGPILRVTSPALGSDDLSLDQSDSRAAGTYKDMRIGPHHVFKIFLDGMMYTQLYLYNCKNK